jgi:hypothetical protein
MEKDFHRSIYVTILDVLSLKINSKVTDRVIVSSLCEFKG